MGLFLKCKEKEGIIIIRGKGPGKRIIHFPDKGERLTRVARKTFNRLRYSRNDVGFIKLMREDPVLACSRVKDVLKAGNTRLCLALARKLVRIKESSYAARVYLLIGDKKEAEKLIPAIEAKHEWTQAAQVYAELGNKQKALACIESDIAENASTVPRPYYEAARIMGGFGWKTEFEQLLKRIDDHPHKQKIIGAYYECLRNPADPTWERYWVPIATLRNFLGAL